ncbi:MAG: peptidoglycan DD-metalloendopeptidase family protein [Bryobacterales bacterium]|nr:peptidoglycan DD-metalloendopeptidase family protein [Bryobacterales bacterium]
MFLRFVVERLRAGDGVDVEWVDPGGAVHASTPFDQLPAEPSLCLLTQLPVGGFAAAAKVGRWTVRVRWAGRELAVRHFDLTGVPGGGAGVQITQVVAREGGPGKNELAMEGTGFNDESLVHIAQYTNSGGWRYIHHLSPRTVTPGRLTVVVDALPPAEYVVFVKNASGLSAPARLIIATAGYRLPFPPHEQWMISQPPYGGYSHWGRTMHAYDMAPRGGGCVVAMRPGVVMARDMGYGQTPRLRIFGNYVSIRHDDGEYSHYAHLKTGTFRVKTGDRVEAGQALATAGNSGYSFGTHVHVQVTREAAIASQSIPFKIEDAPPVRGMVQSTNYSQFGNCSGPRPAGPAGFLSTALAPAGVPAAVPPTWESSVPVASWWSELTTVPARTGSLEVKLGWDSAERDFDLHLVSPSGRHYGSYGDRTGYTSAATEEAFVIERPEAGTWRVSVQGMRGTGGPMPFRVYRNLAGATAGRGGVPNR